MIEKSEDEVEIYKDVVRVLMEKRAMYIFLDKYSPTEEVYVCLKTEAPNESPDDHTNQWGTNFTFFVQNR